MEFSSNVSRRRYLQIAGATGLTVGLAGCGGGGGNGDDGGGNGGSLDGADYPAVDTWLTETDVGAAAPNYDGSMIDWRDESAVQIDVGTGDTGTEFDPPAVAVATGTTVTWEWTGEGGAHNVEAEPEGQIGESDYEFSSGEPVVEAGTTYEQTLEDPGVVLYHCEPHLSVGMKGGIVVE